MDANRLDLFEKDLEALLEGVASELRQLPDDQQRFHEFHRLDDAEATKPLYDLLRSRPEIQALDRTFRAILSTGSTVRVEEIVRWLAIRASYVGAKQAVDDLLAYLRDDTFPVRYAEALVGLEIAEPIRLIDGIELRSATYRDFFASRPAGVLREPENWEAIRQVSAMLICDVRHPKLHTAGIEPQAESYQLAGHEAESVRKKLSDVRLVLSLVARGSVLAIGERVSVPFRVLQSHGEVSLSYRPYPPETPAINAVRSLQSNEPAQAAQLTARFFALPSGVKDYLRVALERYGRVASQMAVTVDGAIDLGIAFEALLLNDNPPGEFSYRLSLRGARLLGSDLEQRRSLQSLLKSVYDLRSSAAHRGVLPRRVQSGQGAASVNEQFRLAVDVLAKAIEIMIDRSGVEDWDEIVLA